VTKRKTIIARAKVMDIWLVTVKLYGSIPRRLQIRMNINKLKIMGVYFNPFLPTFWHSISVIMPYISSPVICNRPGTRLFDLNAELKKLYIIVADKIIKIAELVMLMSYSPIWRGRISLIRN
jgi:hypothetical protein